MVSKKPRRSNNLVRLQQPCSRSNQDEEKLQKGVEAISLLALRQQGEGGPTGAPQAAPVPSMPLRSTPGGRRFDPY